MQTFRFCLLILLLPIIAQAHPQTVTVTVQNRPIARFTTSQAFGATVDGLEQHDIAKVYTTPNITAMAAVGYGSLSYRLRTELAVEAWHWNPQGTWSDPAHHQGYWTSNPTLSTTQHFSNGYRLPHRGSTIDQAENNGYSRLDDNNLHTYWKSNPYLDSHFTHDPSSQHPQWVVIDLGAMRPVNTVRLAWGPLYAAHCQLQYWPGPSPPRSTIDQTYDDTARWQTFPHGTVVNGHGGTQTLRVCSTPLRTQFVRLWLTQAPRRLLKPNQDLRDILGYSLCEIGVGTASSHAGTMFHDYVHHAPSRTHQSIITVSSTDPWHQASGRDPSIEQPGLREILHSPLTHHQPALVPVGVLYDTPANAAALLRALKNSNIPLRGIELGEEPDGQYVTPEDYAALYIQCAQALRMVDPHITLGGPSFQTDINGWTCWPDSHGSRSWVNRFLTYLTQHHENDTFQFLSFEWYPFDNVCAPAAPQLLQAPQLLAQTIARLHHEGIPAHFPLVISEYGYSSFAGQTEMELPAALLNTQIAAQFLALGGTTSYVYGLEPNIPISEADHCATWGNLTLFLSDQNRHIQQKLPACYAQQMLTQDWAQPNTQQRHSLYSIRITPACKTLTAYAVLRPDKQWAVLLLSADPTHGQTIKIHFQSPAQHFIGSISLTQYSPQQYTWHAATDHGFARPDLPPVHRTLPASTTARLFLPPYSLTVVRGRLASPP